MFVYLGVWVEYSGVSNFAQTALAIDQPVEVDGPVDIRSAGAIYTPDFLARWVAGVTLRLLDDGGKRIWDLAVGEGALLGAVEDLAPSLHQLVGLDIDERALARAHRQLPAAHLVRGDALRFGPDPSPSELVDEALERPDAVIINPPWGASLRHSPGALRSSGFSLASGQFDSYDLFVELALGIVAPGGVVAMILPDSLLRPEHQRTRRLLATETTMELIARLGEGFFPGVFQGTVVVVARKGRSSPGHQVSCLRLAPSERRAVLSGGLTLEEAEAGAHAVPQSEFKQSPQVRFDIDARDSDRAMLSLIEARGTLDWDLWTRAGRGIELSKTGQVVLCPACGWARPRPRTAADVRCMHCATEFEPSEESQLTIIVKRGGPVPAGWAPLAVGEDVGRYRCAASRQIRLDVPGVRYKHPPGDGRERLLIRKTGIGIKAAVERTGMLTNQVVFGFEAAPHGREVPFLLDYMAGVLNSRVMLAYHLQSSGESEWRSHPYLSQSAVKALPIPAPDEHARVRLTMAKSPGFRRLGKSYGEVLDELNGLDPIQGYYWREYGPAGDPANGCPPRKYFTAENAGRIDAIDSCISEWSTSGQLTERETTLLRHDLVLAVNRVANIAGTYGHFRSSWTKSAEAPLELRPSTFGAIDPGRHRVSQGPAETVAAGLSADLCYLDPPYTKRQYAANYHLPETIARGDQPEAVGVSGLRPWRDQYSDFCSKVRVRDSFRAIISGMDCPRFLVSYSEDGLLSEGEMTELLSEFGDVECHKVIAQRFRSNQSRLSPFLTEYVFDLQKKPGSRRAPRRASP